MRLNSASVDDSVCPKCSSIYFSIQIIMARSDEAAAWFTAVYQAVQQIPPGKVTSYGHIARLLGKGELAREDVVTSRVIHQYLNS